MKKQIVKATAVVMFLMTLVTSALTAQTNDVNPTLNVQFAGRIENQPVFEVVYSKASNEAYTLTIKDNKGYVFYTDVFRNSYAKKFMLDIPAEDLGEIIITLTDKKGNEKQVYKINGNEAVLHDLASRK